MQTQKETDERATDNTALEHRDWVCYSERLGTPKQSLHLPTAGVLAALYGTLMALKESESWKLCREDSLLGTTLLQENIKVRT